MSALSVLVLSIVLYWVSVMWLDYVTARNPVFIPRRVSYKLAVKLLGLIDVHNTLSFEKWGGERKDEKLVWLTPYDLIVEGPYTLLGFALAYSVLMSLVIHAIIIGIFSTLS